MYSVVMSRQPKVMLNILHVGSIHAGLETMVMKWAREYSDKFEFELFLPSARPIPNNRNKVAKQFIEGDWDILFMFDSGFMI